MFVSIKDLNLVKKKRIYEKIKIGRFFLSIQCGKGFYCNPQDDLPIEEYDQFELALFDERDNWINPHCDNLLKDHPIVSHFEDGIKNPVAPFVPLQDILDFANFVLDLG